MISEKVKKYFDHAMDAVFAVILVFIILGVAIGTEQLFVTTWKVFHAEGLTGHYIGLIADVLTLYVLIELSRSLVEYFDTHKLRLTFITDAAIIFIIRELLIGIFKHELNTAMIYAFSALIFVLGSLRVASILLYQSEAKISK